MILVLLICLMMGGGLLAWVSEKWSRELPSRISLITMLASFAIILWYWISQYRNGNVFQAGWLTEFNIPWIESFGVSFHLAIDGLSLLMVVLTLFLGVIAVLTSWSEIKIKVGFYYFNLL